MDSQEGEDDGEDSVDEGEVSSDDAGATIAERDVTHIAESFLEECTELRYEQYNAPANVQRIKDAMTRVTARQTAAIKRAIAHHVSPCLDLDELIDPIMTASQQYSTSWREQRGREQRQQYRVQPVRRSLGTHPIQHEVRDGQFETRPEELFAYDIPIEQSLQRELMYNPSFAPYMSDWSEWAPNQVGTYTSTQDAHAARDHPELGNTTYDGPSRLAFAHYYDDVEVVNPIGAARTKHKLGLHYVQLLNPPPHIRSDLDMIFLATVVLKSTQDVVGISDVVQGSRTEANDGSSLGASLRRFHEASGIQFQMPHASSQAFRGWLLLLSADTLAAAELIGFKKSFGPNVKAPCWQCDACSGEQLRKPCSFHAQGPCPFHLRTSANYRDQRRQAKAKSSAERKKFKQSIGVNTYQHAYTRIPYFDIIRHVPRDLMHVELEGNLKVHLYGFLYMAIKYKWFTRAQLNARIKAFPFLSKVRRPPPIPSAALKGRKGKLPRGKGTIPYTSGHMLHFVLHSLEILRPLLAQHPSAFDSPEYKAWVAHVRYFAALMKSSFTDESIRAVDRMIYRAQRLFLAISAYAKLWKPKNHFAQHIPGDILQFGPPRTYWCMRFEAKNQDHKKAAKMGNFKNTPMTVSTFHAERSAHRLSKKRKREDVSLRHNGVELEPGMWVRVVQYGTYQEKLAKIRSVARAESGKIRISVEAFNLHAVLQNDSEGGMCVEASDLVGGRKCSVLLDESICVVALLAVPFEGSVRFVEQP